MAILLWNPFPLWLAVSLSLHSCTPRSSSTTDAQPSLASAAPSQAIPALRTPTIAPIVLPLGYYTPEGSVAPSFLRGLKTTPDHHWPEAEAGPLELDDTFVFELGLGDGMNGLNVTTISPRRQGIHYFRVEGDASEQWLEVEFPVTQADLDRLIRVLNEARFLGLPATCEAEVQDGAQGIAHLVTRGREKYVYVSNCFPAGFLRVATFVCEELVDSRSELRNKAKPSSVRDSVDDHLWAGARRYRLGDAGALANSDASGWVHLTLTQNPQPGSLLEAVLLDRTAGGRVLARERINSRLSRVPYDPKAIRWDHEYILKITHSPRQGLSSAQEFPVLTFGGPHALAVPANPH